MANFQDRVSENVSGEFFVDRTCIDCDTCRQLAPRVFGEGPEHSFVLHQPNSVHERRAALHALLACPTGSIGTEGAPDPATADACGHVLEAKQVLGDFPLLLEAPVYYCGFNSPKSYGGNSYLIRHPEGNWLVDSPKYLPHLVRRLEGLGGVSHIFLTHRDDVADATKYAERFDADRIIHRDELSSQPDAEIIIDGDAAIEVSPGFTVIPTPGHTAGHCVLLFNQKFLFTGDHLYWDRHTRRLAAFEDYCWDSWPQQVESLRRLLDYRFDWVLPGHGERVHLPAEELRVQLEQLVSENQPR